ncbi:MAG: hypothetical protein ACPG4N_04545 [Gammaproteobacteria bacterium]
MPSIEIPESTIERLAKHAKPFEPAGQVIERLIDFVEAHPRPASPKLPSFDSKPSTHTHARLPPRLVIHYHPDDYDRFKELLLLKREAWLRLEKLDGSVEFKNWNASQFSATSDVNGNLRSGYLRGWRDKQIVRCDIAIRREDLDD